MSYIYDDFMAEEIIREEEVVYLHTYTRIIFFYTFYFKTYAQVFQYV